jgi:hypothetical protein
MQQQTTKESIRKISRLLTLVVYNFLASLIVASWSNHRFWLKWPQSGQSTLASTILMPKWAIFLGKNTVLATTGSKLNSCIKNILFFYFFRISTSGIEYHGCGQEQYPEVRFACQIWELSKLKSNLVPNSAESIVRLLLLLASRSTGQLPQIGPPKAGTTQLVPWDLLPIHSGGAWWPSSQFL